MGIVLESEELRASLIHTGNTVNDTEGCLIIGDKIGVVKQKDAVLNSKAAYLRFYDRIIGSIKAGGQEIDYADSLMRYAAGRRRIILYFLI